MLGLQERAELVRQPLPAAPVERGLAGVPPIPPAVEPSADAEDAEPRCAVRVRIMPSGESGYAWCDVHGLVGAAFGRNFVGRLADKRCVPEGAQ